MSRKPLDSLTEPPRAQVRVPRDRRYGLPAAQLLSDEQVNASHCETARKRVPEAVPGEAGEHLHVGLATRLSESVACLGHGAGEPAVCLPRGLAAIRPPKYVIAPSGSRRVPMSMRMARGRLFIGTWRVSPCLLHGMVKRAVCQVSGNPAASRYRP